MLNADGVLNLSEIISDNSNDKYNEIITTLYEYCFEEDLGRHAQLEVNCGNGVERLSIGKILVSLALLYPYHVAGVKPKSKYFIRKPLTSNLIEEHLTRTIQILYKYLDTKTLNLAISTSTTYLADIGCAIVGRVGTTVSIKGLLDAAKLDPVINEILYWKAPEGELNDIEKAADEVNSDLMNRLMAIPNEFGRLLKSGSSINKDQMRQVFVNIGVKPGLLDGELIPEPIDTSFLQGMRHAQDFYICAVGARKSLITNFRQVKTSGYLSRKLVLLVADHFIDKETIDCETLYGVKSIVQNEDHVERLIGRYIKTDITQDWFIPTQSEFLELIGQEILIRSPITCACKTGICHKCYGELASTNAKIHAGIYGVLVIAEQITQRLLSSKHLLKARPRKINWSDEFLSHFVVERTMIYAESSVDKVYVRLEDIVVDEDEDTYTTNVFSFKIFGKQKKVKITTSIPITLDTEIWNINESTSEEFSVTPIGDNPIFYVPVKNSDLSETLYAIFNLIEREKIDSISIGYNKLMELLIKSQINTPSIHAEIILRALVRDPVDNMVRPDFSTGPDEPEYVMLKLPQAILASPSITNSIAFERVKAQLTSIDILKKDKKSVIDSLFSE
jgi:hypothetical protein